MRLTPYIFTTVLIGCVLFMIIYDGLTPAFPNPLGTSFSLEPQRGIEFEVGNPGYRIQTLEINIVLINVTGTPLDPIPTLEIGAHVWIEDEPILTEQYFHIGKELLPAVQFRFQTNLTEGTHSLTQWTLEEHTLEIGATLTLEPLS